MQGAPWRPGMRAGGEGAFLTNPGVLVTHVRPPFPPGLRASILVKQLSHGPDARKEIRERGKGEKASFCKGVYFDRKSLRLGTKLG